MAGLSGFLAIAGEAWSAHGLSELLSERGVEAVRTALRFQLVHSVALVMVGSRDRVAWWGLKGAGTFFVGGIVLFCGTIYLQFLAGFAFLSSVTPIGGLSFMMGWLLISSLIFRSE
ncbi:MAG: DUF423 domain-containing protein [bacterium]